MPTIPDSVKAAYLEPHRHYHNLEHILSILTKIPLFQEHYRFGETNREKLTVIAWYHDVIYVPGASNNETLSALQLESDMKDEGWWSDVAMAEMSNTIWATKQHKHPPTWISAIFFDLDLADMGTDAYHENSLKIREEFGMFSDDEWFAGRIKFLTDFLARPFIFHTSLGYSLWEGNARKNMELELDYLKRKYGVSHDS